MVFISGGKKPTNNSHFSSSMTKPKKLNRHLPRLIILGLVILALFLRLYQLHAIPPSIFIDEYNLFADALKINLGEPHPPWYGIGWYGTPQLSILIFSWLIGLFGTGWLSFKLAWGIPAFLLLPVVYKLAKNLFDRQTAMISLLILAIFPAHIHLSRWAHGAIIVTTLNMASVLLWYLGTTNKKLHLTALSAVILAISLQTYVGARSFILFFVLAFWGYWIKSILGKKYKNALSQTLVFGLTLGLILISHINYGRSHSVEMWARTTELSVIKKDLTFSQNWQSLQNNAQLYGRMIVGTLPDPNLRHDPLRQSVIPFPVFWFGLVGLVLLFINRRFSHLYLVISLYLTSLVGGLFSIEAPSIFRTNLVLVPLALSAGYAVIQIWHLLPGYKKQTKFSKVWLIVLLIGLTSGSLIQLRQYYGLADRTGADLQQAFTSFENQVASQAVAEMRSGRPVYLSPDYFWFSSTQYQVKSLGLTRFLHLFEPGADLSIWQGATLILDDNYVSLIEYLKTFWPAMQIEKVQTPAAKSFWLVRLPPGSPTSSQTTYGLIRTCQLISGETETKIESTIFTSFTDPDNSLPAEEMPVSCTWTGYLRVPQAGRYGFSINADDDMTLTLTDAGRPVVEVSSDQQGQVDMLLAPTTYQIKASYTNDGGAAGAYVYVQSEQDNFKQALPPLWLRPK